jgi:hypothetical protein
MVMGDQYLLGTCFHQAGHAIVAAALGLEVLNIRINKDGGATDVSNGPLSLIDQVAVCYAGVIAQDIWQLLPEHLAEHTAPTPGVRELDHGDTDIEPAAAGGERVALAAVRGHQAEVCD